MKILRLALPILIASAVSAQTSAPLLEEKVIDLLHESLSGELAKEHVISITRNHRIQGSRGYRDAARYVLGQLKKFGFAEKDATIESFPSDGKIHYQTWQSPSGWDISSAELRMVEPYDERIAGYPEIAMSVITYSNPGDATAELVWAGGGTSDDDYKGKDVKGKFVLATGYGGAVHRLAVLKYNAKAVVCYLDDDRAGEYPDMLQYTGMWPKSTELAATTFGFNLTNRQGEKLKALLDATGQDYTVCVSTAVHEGSPWEEVGEAGEKLRAIFGDQLRMLGYLADDALAKELHQCSAAAMFFDPALRANNTTFWAAMDAGAIVITNLDANSPALLGEDRRGGRPAVQTWVDINRLDRWPTALLASLRSGRCQPTRPRGYTWDDLVRTMRASGGVRC